MIPTIGLMIAVYAIARLVQVPLESLEKRPWGVIVALSVVSLVAMAAIAFMAIDLIFSAGRTPTPMPGLQ